MLKDKALQREYKSKASFQSGSLTDSIKASKSIMRTGKHFILLTMICTEKENISCILLIFILVLNICCILREKISKEKKDV